MIRFRAPAIKVFRGLRQTRSTSATVESAVQPEAVEPSFVQADIDRTLKFAKLEAFPARVALAVSESFVMPMGILLKASAIQIGQLGSLPQLVAALAQLLTPALIIRLGSRKRVLQLSCALGAAVWIGSMTVPLLPSSARVWALLAFAVTSLALYNLPNPAWASWISSLVPVSGLGRYLGVRTMIASVAALIVFLFGGLFLDSMKDRALWGFVALFGIAALSRGISVLIFSRVYDPQYKRPQSGFTDIFISLAALPRGNLGRFIVYTFVLYFGVYVSGPFFVVYQLRDLQFSYTIYMGLAVVSTFSAMLGLRILGPMSDRTGNVRVIRITALGVSLAPLLWLMVNDPIDAALIQVVGGISWAGWTLCSVNFVYESSNDENRAQNVAYFYAINGIGIFLGGLTGGFLVDHIPEILGSTLLTLFVISGIVRFAAAGLFLPWVSEVRSVTPGPSADSVQ